MTRTVADAALLLTVHSGPEGRDPRQGDGVAAVDYRKALTGEVSGLRVGLLSEGFGQPSSQVDEVVRSAARRFTEIGCTVSEVSVPWHRHALAVFAVIFTDGATYQMLDGNGYGVGADGLYDPELMAYFASRRPRQRHAARSGSRNGREHRAAGCQRPPPRSRCQPGSSTACPSE